jgi:hypothetical protein
MLFSAIVVTAISVIGIIFVNNWVMKKEDKEKLILENKNL